MANRVLNARTLISLWGLRTLILGMRGLDKLRSSPAATPEEAENRAGDAASEMPVDNRNALDMSKTRDSERARLREEGTPVTPSEKSTGALAKGRCQMKRPAAAGSSAGGVVKKRPSGQCEGEELPTHTTGGKAIAYFDADPPSGWIAWTVAGRHDKYYKSPKGKQFRTLKAVDAFLA